MEKHLTGKEKISIELTSLEWAYVTNGLLALAAKCETPKSFDILDSIARKIADALGISVDDKDDDE